VAFQVRSLRKITLRQFIALGASGAGQLWFLRGRPPSSARARDVGPLESENAGTLTALLLSLPLQRPLEYDDRMRQKPCVLALDRLSTTPNDGLHRTLCTSTHLLFPTLLDHLRKSRWLFRCPAQTT
jgi:hypothetical protein